MVMGLCSRHALNIYFLNVSIRINKNYVVIITFYFHFAMSLSKEEKVKWLQNELAKLSSALVDAEKAFVDAEKASVDAEKTLIDAENEVESLKACIDIQKSKLDEMLAEEAAGIKVEILPILEFTPPAMRAGSKLFKVTFDVRFTASVIREFTDYCKVPAKLMWVYGSATVQHVEVRETFECFAAEAAFFESEVCRVGRHPSTLQSSIKKRIEQEAAAFFEVHELVPDGSIFPAPVYSTRVPKENRTIALSAQCWVFVQGM